MKLSREDVVTLANLAHLSLKEDEVEKYREQISSILNYVGMLNEVESAALALSGTDAVNVLREDKARVSDPETRAKIVKNFPTKKDDFLTVPAVFGK